MRRILRFLLVGVVVLAAVLGVVGWYYLFREVPTDFASDVEHFKYGSVGVEAENGVPYWVWYVLPKVCEGRPAGREGYADFGFIWEEGKEAPIGLPMKTVGFRRLGVNCGLCHTATVRSANGSEETLLIGAPSTTFDLQSYLRFLFSCAESPDFNADKILRAIEVVHDLPLMEGLLYRYLVIPQMRQALLTQKGQLSWMDHNPDWGPGRADPFNPAKAQILRLPADGSVGNSDIVPLWNWAPRSGFGLHWDGLNTSLREIFLNSGIGNGASNKTIDLRSLERIESWIQQLEPTPFPYPIDRELAATGEEIYARHCADCHAFGGGRTGQPVALEQLGTDYHRLASWSGRVAERFNGLDLYDWRYADFRPTYGYVAVPLDGIWARAPYLHNGSVPTLRDLLEADSERPASFYRGYDVYDPVRVGFVSDVAEASGRDLFRLDTRVPGNSNRGHAYGTALEPPEKDALLEYLKSL